MGVSTDVPASTSAQQPIIIPPTAEEEDHIVHARITNDERPLRRVIKKFYQYQSVVREPIVPQINDEGQDKDQEKIEQAREAFMIELASFQLLLKKSILICEAEARQVEGYQREKQRIDDEHGTLRGQIEQLKTSLEDAQMLRRRKIEYDVVAEKVNSLPSREELEQSIAALENDMAAIRAEHETQNRTIETQKIALDGIISTLSTLRFAGGDGASTSLAPSARGTPGLDGPDGDGTSLGIGTPAPMKSEEEGEEGEEKVRASSVPDGAEKSVNGDDIEMGEVEEEVNKSTRGKKSREDLEEGEATDGSSELSEPPDDID
ncbi:hypothetical protein E1B28_004192 [Marasmius oreades]|uniref:Uncharacterized protein n=1 Tax=Marasmius oreades TaxID=181124 RepID=A0A9P7UY32_9AGAR|nr:uncharacterized protein E1B28_004192 [Marasmius oreades]KAG7096782.1 hypothetical protein E1B28_004192 [Marasmius oreades]